MTATSETIDAGVLFETYHDRIYRYILRLVHSPAEAEDLTQETFLRAYRHGDALRNPDAVRGWLYRIATHVCLDRLRQRRPVLSLDGEQVGLSLQAAASQSPSPFDLTEREETSACVQRCLDFLPDPYRAVILLHEAHGLSAPEIADLLHLTLATVKIRLHRARRKLQGIMKEGCAVLSDSRGLPTCAPKNPPSRSQHTPRNHG